MTISSRQPVSGAWGFGKVYLTFRPRKPKTISLGFIVFVLLFITHICVMSWRNSIVAKEAFLGPCLRRAAIAVDTTRFWLNGLMTRNNKVTVVSLFVHDLPRIGLTSHP
jgi:hypothetical protein